jgi:hypothetical protein
MVAGSAVVGKRLVNKEAKAGIKIRTFSGKLD